MAEKDANNSSHSVKNSSFNDHENENIQEIDNAIAGSSIQSKREENNESFEVDSSTSSYESTVKKEENPFSFKKFLNQDSFAQKNKGARKKIYPASNVVQPVCKLDETDTNLGRYHSDINSRLINGADVSTVLPDFVQDHLVIEQCYLSGCSKMKIDNLGLQNLPDLNIEHQNVHLTTNLSRGRNQSSNQYSNLPDFTLGARNHSSALPKSSKTELPDFALNFTKNAALNGNWANNPSSNCLNNSTKKRVNQNETNDASHNRSTAPLPSSPSVSHDLPLYENNTVSNQNMQLSFDLTIPNDEKTGSNRLASASDPVSISLPDFLSDGPIKKELDGNFKCNRGDSSIPNGFISSDTLSLRLGQERLIKEIDSLRCQLSEKNMKIERLESELQHLQNTDQKDTANLEHVFKEVESNLKHTTKRAQLAEEMILKLKQENKLLKFEISSLKSENMELRLGDPDSKILPSQINENHRIAKELRAAANMAETSLRSLLNGIENLRVIASTMESVQKFQDNCEDYETFLKEDSASGPAL